MVSSYKSRIKQNKFKQESNIKISSKTKQIPRLEVNRKIKEQITKTRNNFHFNHITKLIHVFSKINIKIKIKNDLLVSKILLT